MKRLCCIALILLLLLSGGCVRQPAAIGVIEKPVNEISQADESVAAQVEALIAAQVKAVHALDAEAYMSYISPADAELIKEQANWFNDLRLEPVESFSIKLLEADKVDEDNYRVSVEQSYTRGGKSFSTRFQKRLTVVDGAMYDAGNYFEEISNERFVIKYTEKNKKLAEDLLPKLLPLYEEYTDTWGVETERKIIIKFFEDKEALRHSIKLSMWACAGWYEYGESVRMYIDRSDDVERLVHVIRHEMVHLFTMLKSNGNLPYWLAEGLAMNYQYENGPFKDLRSSINSYGGALLSVDELEAMELERLTSNSEIRAYYGNSQLLVSLILESYGKERLDRVLEELGKKPAMLSGTGHENDKVYKEYLHEVLPKELGLSSYQEFKELWLKKTKQ